MLLQPRKSSIDLHSNPIAYKRALLPEGFQVADSSLADGSCLGSTQACGNENQRMLLPLETFAASLQICRITSQDELHTPD
ncbi:hypothetical protein PABG_11719 [Paracoccidioides brasiliensis Pb03]|uniref:Uncharacterized protein n=2 Tax=Paracoccidioides brasiliensis TaxID=121759 RepID=A0A0A0HVS7_PARBD|nr:uncharacterized protein PADG_11320 [Paracoccidioides brasiliensis Pb18]KGM92498.1 hypothetical protein PADG_11320 [Paracoccidioides brasiliensis Pb18]KGY15413.1 hypothetical protein PABG_11719 [Paracoccidioides brasiliensis Pb03]ODH29849.1 hypothetical protein ACO22_03673 [Paracoccidioides brasiliensis]ODH47958.1 hypothetical protein GX48_05980 [Paracoccidioides brasiliensis]